MSRPSDDAGRRGEGGPFDETLEQLAMSSQQDQFEAGARSMARNASTIYRAYRAEGLPDSLAEKLVVVFVEETTRQAQQQRMMTSMMESLTNLITKLDR